MPSPLFVTFLFVVWVVGVVVGGIYDAAVTPNQSNLNALIRFDIFTQADIGILGFNLLTLPVPNFSWFPSMIGLLAWDHSLFGGWANHIRIMVPLAFSFGIILPLIVQMLRKV